MGRTPDDVLTDKQEHYAQLRSQGYTQSAAAATAYETKHPGKLGWEIEQKQAVKDRITQLRLERNEAYGLDVAEQIRRYNELYFLALKAGKLETARSMLERLDSIGGFNAPSKSEVTRKTTGDSFKDPEGDLKKDLEKFKGVLTVVGGQSKDKS